MGRMADLHLLGEGGDVSHQTRTVQPVCLGQPDHIEPGLLELCHLGCSLAEAAGIAKKCRDLHRHLGGILIPPSSLMVSAFT
jgi:hypothetical protein